MVRRKRPKLVSAILVLLGILGVIYLVITTHGQLWSVQSIRYKQLLESLPEPPGYLPKTGFVQAFPEYPHGYRYFGMKGQYSETISFFKIEVPKQEWGLSSIEASGPTNILPGKYGSSTTLRFTNQLEYCLEIQIITSTDQEGIQLDDEIAVHIFIFNNIECKRPI